MSINFNINVFRNLAGAAILLTAIAGIVLLLRPDTANASPEFLNYQGTLTDSNGQPLAGSHILQFNIYDGADPGASNLVWGPFTAEVEIASGRFNAVLGPEDAASPDARSIKDAFAGSGDRFIEIKVGNSAPILPRQQFLSTPFAVQAHRAQSAAHADNGVPVGTIISWWGDLSEMPDGFELCDGQAPTTPGALLSGKPDLREKFLQGSSPNDMSVGDLGDGGFPNHNLAHGHTHGHSHGHGSLHARVFVGGDSGDRTVAVQSTQGNQWGVSQSATGINAGGGTFTTTRSAIVDGSTSGANTNNTSGSLASIDNRPPFCEVYFLIRVK